MPFDTPNSGIGLSEAAARFEAILTPETDNQADTDSATPTEEVATEEVAAADTSTEETPAEDDDAALVNELDNEEGEDGEAETGEEEATDEDAEAEEAADPLKQLFTVKIQGKEEQVSLEEALKGYQRNADYTRKAMALAEEKKAFEPEREAVALERQQYAELLPILIAQIESGLGGSGEPPLELLDTNPAEYMRQERLYREQQERLAAARAEKQRLDQIAQEEQGQAMQRYIAESGAKLAEAMPRWKKPEVWAADAAKLKEYGAKLGFSAEELEHTYDHRAILALYKAMRYDEIMSKRPQPQAQERPKPAAAGAAKPVQQRKVSELTRDKQRLAKTGSVKDAAAIFGKLL
jgi:hypothetical protein